MNKILKKIKFFLDKKEKIYIVDFNNQIIDKKVKQFYKDMEYIKQLSKKEKKAIILRLNCPGGSPSLSYEMSKYIEDFKKENNLYIYIESMAASGGYFLAASGGEIYSNPYAIVGSIGVIMNKYEFSELSKKVGIKEDNISVGNYKQPMSFFKPLEEKEKEYLKKQLMNPTYDLFVDYIYKSRNIEKDIIKDKYADGKIFIANEVVGSLVDKITTFQELIEEIKNGEDIELVFVKTKKKKLLERIGMNININVPNLENKISMN